MGKSKTTSRYFITVSGEMVNETLQGATFLPDDYVLQRVEASIDYHTKSSSMPFVGGSEIHSSPWGEFLLAIARGEQPKLKWKRGYGLVVLITVPPFPYSKKLPHNSSYGINIYFDEKLKKEDFKHIHFEEVSLRSDKIQHFISDHRGYILYVTGMGQTIEHAQKKVYDLAKKIYIPKMFYRNDIGDRFINGSQDQLREWGYL